MSVILDAEAKKFYQARVEEIEAAKELAAAEKQIEELLKTERPDLLLAKSQAEERRAKSKEAGEAAYKTFVGVVKEHAENMLTPYGRGKVFPYATVEEKTFVEPASIADIPRVVEWLVARGLHDCITLKFSPVTLFRSAKDQGSLPRRADGITLAMRVFTAPAVKVDSHERWPVDFLDKKPGDSDAPEGVVVVPEPA